ncbi:MAG TPA: hypothetical protein VNO14_01630, partial [Blastocatellia bacterium]|nr:hypothetical protein [Blastocatellia bacterium]
PPMYSAKKVGGERLYRAARAGRELDREPVQVIVHSLRLREEGGPVFELMEDGTLECVMEVECSSGTYIRTLAHDLGQRLGTGGHLVSLRRTRVGHFDISEAISLEQVVEAGAEGTLEHSLVSCSETVRHLPALRLDRRDIVRVRHGLAVRSDRIGGEGLEASGRQVRLLDKKGELVAVGEIDLASGVIRPRVVLYERDERGA